MRDSKRLLDTPLRAGTVFSGLSSLLLWIRHWPWSISNYKMDSGSGDRKRRKAKCPEDTEHGFPGFLFFCYNTREVHKEARGRLRSQLVGCDKYMTNEAWRTGMFQGCTCLTATISFTFLFSVIHSLMFKRTRPFKDDISLTRICTD